jgi:hypothetical protein
VARFDAFQTCSDRADHFHSLTGRLPLRREFNQRYVDLASRHL